MGLSEEDGRRLGIAHAPQVSERMQALIDRANARMGRPAPDLARAPAVEDEKQAHHRRAGRMARATGAAAEMLVEAARTLHPREVVLWPMHAAVRQVGPKGPDGVFPAVRTEEGAGGDFRGLLGPDVPARLVGRALVVEVKSAETSHLGLVRHRKPIIRQQQLDDFEAVARAGGLAGLVVRVRETWWYVPFVGWQRAVAEARADTRRSPQGRQSLSPGHLDAVGRRCEMVGPLPRWIAALLAFA